MPADPRRVLVAGATGRLGAVTHALLARGHAVRAMTRDVVALAVLAIERPSDFAGERIRVACDALNAEEAADALSRQTGRQFAAQQLDTDELGPGLQALFSWLERTGHSVDIPALHGRYPIVRWHSYQEWLESQRARLAALCPHEHAAVS
jgi:uncharacterized protein YbjT (DUF2867 family)